MSETVNVQAKKQLAKLLATENITVVHAGTRTATFDPKRRILTLPIWKDMDGDLYDLLVLHEVGHALNTPRGSKPLIDACNKIDPKYPASAHSFVNVVEDARIEKLMKRRYPGARASFIRGYNQLVERNFFKTLGRDINESGIIDRINIHFKAGFDAGVIFTDEEMEFVTAIEAVMTFSQVVDIAQKLYVYAKKERADKKKAAQEAQSDLEFDGDEDEDEKQGKNDKKGKKVAKQQMDDEDSDEIDPDVEPAGLPDEEDDGDGGSQQDIETDDEGDDEDSGDDKSSGKGEEDDATESTDVDDGGSGIEDKEEAEDSDDNVSGKESDTSPPDQEEVDDSPITSETDSAWTEQQDELRDKNARPIRYLGVPKPKLDKIIVDYKTVHQSIRAFYSRYDMRYGQTLLQQHIQEFDRFKHENKPVVDWLLKEFEMHKAADQYARIHVSKTGELDMNRVHEYRYNDDIMKRNAIIPGGKNHANLTFVDFSGSMKEHILGTFHQLINLAMFQRKAQIPFRVFTFGINKLHSRQNNHMSKTSANVDVFDHKEDDYAFYEGYTLREVLSSKMTAKEFNDACVNLLMLASGAENGANIYSSAYTYDKLPPDDQMGGTPLNETIVCAIPLTEEMYRAGAQFVNVTFLTDGEATTRGWYVRSANGDITLTDFYSEAIYLRDDVTHHDYKLVGDDIEDTNQFLRLFRERTKSKAIGFFICGGAAHQKATAYSHFLKERDPNNAKNIAKLDKELEENFFLVGTQTGYTEFYILPSGDQLKINSTSQSPLKGLFANDQLVTAMTVHGQKQRKHRVLLTRYIKLIS